MSKDLHDMYRRMESAKFILMDDEWDNGCFTFLPYGFQFKELVYRRFSKLLEDSGYSQVQIPRIVPSLVIDKLSDGLVDLRNNVFWLEGSGTSEDSRHYLNSTSGPVWNHLLRRIIRTIDDLPVRVYTREQIFRPHLGVKKSRPFINSDENVDLIETYAINATSEESLADFNKSLDITRAFFDDLCLHYHVIERALWGNKPVAKKVFSLETYFPELRRSLRLGTTYHHDETFSRIFDVKYLDADGGERYAHQTAFGFGERFLLALLSHQSDDDGFCIHPHFSPVQIGILPFTPQEERTARRIKEELDGYRVDISNDYKKRLGSRDREYVLKGVPLRVRVPHSSVDKPYIIRRDNSESAVVEYGKIKEYASSMLGEIEKNLRSKSRDILESNTIRAYSEDELAEGLSDWNLVKFDWCGSPECGKTLESRYPGEVLGHFVYETAEENGCIVCGSASDRIGLYGRRCPSP
jgi:prolyl-tRNA synthetase